MVEKNEIPDEFCMPGVSHRPKVQTKCLNIFLFCGAVPTPMIRGVGLITKIIGILGFPSLLVIQARPTNTYSRGDVVFRHFP